MKTFTKAAGAIVAAGLIAVPSAAFAAGFSNTNQSATAAAMSGTGVANKDEPNATFYNPAYMPYREGLQVYVGDTILLPSSSYAPADGGPEAETKTQVFPPPNAHLAYTFNENMSAGIGLALPWGLGIAWEDDWVGRENIRSQDLQTLNITPAFAYKLSGMDLSFAVGAQIMLSSVELEQSIRLRDDQFVDVALGGSGTGFGGLAAIYYRPVDMVALGLNYRSRATVNYDGNIHFEGEEGTPFEQTFVDGPGTTEITMPDMITLGVAYDTPELLLEFDTSYTMWSTYDEVVLDIEKDLPSDELVITHNWENSFTFRLGAQYNITKAFPVRMGVNYDMTPIPDEWVSASLPGNDRVTGSIGTGYTTDFGLRIDGAYQVVNALEREIGADNQTAAPRGTYQTTAHIFAINVGYGYWLE